MKKPISIALSTILFMSTIAQAGPSGAPVTPESAIAPVTVVHVNPDSLRWYLLSQNTPILISLNNVYQAKAQVSKARGALLPALNVSGAINSVLTAKPSFALSTVSILLPFLLPSNWFQLKSAKHQLAANGYAFYIAELNTYASALGLYTSILSDINLRVVYRNRADYAKHVQDIVSDQVLYGSASKADLAQAKEATELALVQVSQMDELISQEKAAIRKMLNLDLTTAIVFDPFKIAPVKEEQSTPQSLLTQVMETSPEARQIQSLILAQQAQKWSQVFGFFGSASLSAAASGSSGTALSPWKQADSITIGVNNFQAIDINNLQVAGLQIQLNDVPHQIGSVLESTISSVQESSNQVILAAQAEANSKQTYESVLSLYQIGSTDLLHVISAQNDVTNAQVIKVKAQMDLDSQRVGLNRILIANDFSTIPTCQLKGSERTGGVFGFLEDVAHPAKHSTIDTVCRTAPAAAEVATGKKHKKKKK